MKEYTIENEYIRLGVLDYGLRIKEIFIKSLNRNVVLKYHRNEEYLSDENYFGASIGPNANRIEDGRFSIGNRIYQWDINNGKNNLHSGKFGFDKKLWDIVVKNDVLTASLSNQEPFLTDVKVTITLSGYRIDISYEANSKRACILNMTNHTYFNLSSEANVLNHKVKLHSSSYTPLNENQLPTGNILCVKATAFNLDGNLKLWELFNRYEEELKVFSGYDHNFIIDGIGMRSFADIEVEDLALNISSDAKCAQFYTGNFIRIDKEPMPYLGLCIEPQYAPNSMNIQAFDQPRFKENEKYLLNISYLFSLRA